MTSFVEFGLHCIRRPGSRGCVIFVHGILSSGESAWGRPSWPDLLAEEPGLKSLGIYIFTYQTAIRSGTYSIADVADALREQLAAPELKGVRKFIFVCHSMGGIVVRRYLVANQAALSKAKVEIGLFLVASPSLGSADANLMALLSRALRQPHVQLAALRLSQENTSLDELHKDFRTLLASTQLCIVGRELLEDKAISIKRALGLRRQVVEPFAAAAYFSEPGCEPLKIAGSDHNTIVKPLRRKAEQHLALTRFVREFPERARRKCSGRTDPAYLNQLDPDETKRARQLVAGLQCKFGELADKPEALAQLNQAILTTRRYLRDRSCGGERDAGFEARLSDMWRDVGNVLHPHDPELASLCWIKGHGWADPAVWNEFKDLPIGLDELLHRLHEAMGAQASHATAELAEARKAISAIHHNLNAFEAVRPVVAKLEKQPVSNRPNAVTQSVSDEGNALKFSGYGESRKITVEDLKRLPRDDRSAVAASEAGMRKLKRQWEAVVRKGRLTDQDEEDLREISVQMAVHLELILRIVQIGLGGQLQDHYAAQRTIAERLTRRRKRPGARAALPR